MWGMPNEDFAKIVCVLLFMPIWLFGMGSFLFFVLSVAPRALQRWAEAEGCIVVQRKSTWFFTWLSSGSSTCQWLFRVVVKDKSGKARVLLLRFGDALWFSMSAKRCPVEILEDRAVETLPEELSRAGSKQMWYRELD